MPFPMKQNIGLCLVLCLLLMAGCGPLPLSRQTASSTQLASPIARQAAQQLQLPSAAWEPLALPTPNAVLLFSIVSPENSALIYACTGSARTPGVASLLMLWRTRDAGKHWFSLPMPGAIGTTCWIALDPFQQQRIAVQITEGCSYQSSCAHNMLYFSTDGGATWRQSSLVATVPRGATIGQNAIIVAGSHLYLWYDYRIRQDTFQHSLLARSDDDGLTWLRIDGKIEPHGFFLPPQIGQDGRLVLGTRALSPADRAEALLWMSYDAGTSWDQTGIIPPPADNFLLVSPTPQIPLYVLGGEQLPSALYESKVLQSTNGQHWSLLPPLPVRGTSAEHPGLLQALAITDGGELLAFGPDPKVGLPSSLNTLADPMQALWLWLWNPHASTWQVLATPLIHPVHERCGLCWSAQLATNLDRSSSYLYVHHWDEASSFFRVRLPSLAGAYPAANAHKCRAQFISQVSLRPTTAQSFLY